ncbi:MAG TPA: tRNA glutamyl-Q(34) synthetase GluQRS [Polyangiales bacterium]|nr:tRNA glutamyl-Q(34) synthetase GluQRS [Polyangiales bacterium]
MNGYRGRLAPSPTGGLHLGLARTSLCAWLAARAAKGTLVLRIEDIDTPRVVPGSAHRLMEELRFLGLAWDEGPDLGGPYAPYVQSARFDRYEAAIAALRDKGLVYPCTCSRKEIAEQSIASAPHGDLGPRYAGTCRNGVTHPGRPEALRFRMPEVAPTFTDRLHGLYTQGEPDDFVLRRADGVYSYQLAVVVDDIAMRISDVVRADDLLSSTPRQLVLYEALDAAPPSFTHVPLVLDPSGKRMSKRFGSTTITELHDRGVSAERIVGALAHSLGLAAQGESVRARDLVDRFEVGKLPRAASVIEDPT